MAVAGILSSSIFDILNQVSGQHNAHNKFQQIKQEFQQLGSDLQSGNLSQAQTDFAALQQNLPSSAQSSAAVPQSISATTSSPTTNSLTAAVNQLAQDLKAGNLSAAQSDFTAVQQDVQALGQQQGAGGAHHHHHHSSGSDSSAQSSQQDALSALFNQLGSSLQSGNLSTAQQAYSTLQQDFQQFALSSPFTTPGVSSSGPSASSGLNLSA